MDTRRIIAIAILIPFSLLTVYAVMEVGYYGIFEYHLHSPAGWQVFTDLVIALVLVLLWLIPEEKKKRPVTVALGGTHAGQWLDRPTALFDFCRQASR